MSDQLMRKVWWKDLEKPDGQWEALVVEVSNAGKPRLCIETGNNGRLRLSLGDQRIFWATIAKDYAGVWMLKSGQQWPVTQMPIRPITSSDVESRRHIPREERLKSWSRFFARQLTEGTHSFLYNGKWVFGGFLPTSKPWNYSSTHSGLSKWGIGAGIYEVEQAPKQDVVDRVDWWGGSYDLASLKPVDAEAGRIKWWRKKVREGTLPPILVWYLNCLDTYVVIDGHDRLLAAQLENKPPDIVVAYSVEEFANDWDEAIQNKILASLVRTSPVDGRRKMTVAQLNDILIRAFDNEPGYRSITRSWARIASDEVWCEEVRQELTRIGRLDEFDDAIHRNV